EVNESDVSIADLKLPLPLKVREGWGEVHFGLKRCRIPALCGLFRVLPSETIVSLRSRRAAKMFIACETRTVASSGGAQCLSPEDNIALLRSFRPIFEP